jgi:electron transport complex protein RnfG
MRTLAVLKSTCLLGLFAMLGTGFVAFVHDNTKARITANERADLLRSLREIMPESKYDNDVLSNIVEVSDEHLGDAGLKTIYLARKAGEPAGVVLTTVAPQGYNGPITLLVGIDVLGKISGVRVVSHHETPGLGDAIEVKRSPWIKRFNGRSLGDPPVQKWAVKRDGGIFDQFTGATITPRAVVDAVKRSLIYFDEHQSELFSQTGPEKNQGGG